MQKLGRPGLLLLGVLLLGTACGLTQTVTDAYGVTWHQGSGPTPALDEVGCKFDNSEAPDEPLPLDIMAVIEWGGYEAYGGRWIDRGDGPIVEGEEQGPLVVAIVGDATAFEQWLDAEPGRRETSGIGAVAEGEIPYCLIEHGYRLLPTVPGMTSGGVTMNGGEPVIEVIIESIDNIDLSRYPPFMRFTDELKITFDTTPMRLP